MVLSVSGGTKTRLDRRHRVSVDPRSVSDLTEQTDADILF